MNYETQRHRYINVYKSCRRSAITGLCIPVVALILSSVTLLAKPRPPQPPLPGVARLFLERFNEPYQAPTNQMLDTTTWVESWSGYALNRVAPMVQPFVIPMLRTNSTFAVDRDRGGIRVWYSPNWNSASTGLGAGPGSLARILTLVATNGAAQAVYWTLVISPDGNEADVICQQSDGPTGCLRAPVCWQAGEWHLLGLGYTTTNSALFIDDQQVAAGDGMAGVPAEAVSFTSLVIGSSLSGTEVAAGQLEELQTFSGNNRSSLLRGLEFGMNPTVDIARYYNHASQVAVLGPIVSEEAERERLSAQAAAAMAAQSATTPPPPPSGGESGTDGESGGSTNCPLSSQLTGLGILQPVFADSNTLVLTLTNTDAGASYDLYFTTNLDFLPAPALCQTNWALLCRGQPNQTVFVITNLFYSECFFRLGTILDSNGDGVPDAYCLMVLHVPVNTFCGNTSSDGYGTPDLWYLQHGLSPFAAGQDPDQDALLNWQEYRYGSDPNVSDGFAVWLSTPNATSSIP